MPAFESPNILIFLFDSLSTIDIDYAVLPTLSRLREESVVFTSAYTPNPQSSPARASLFTGLDPCVHGLWANGVTLPDTEKTFAEVLLQAGYSNYLAGRYQLAGVSNWTTEQVRNNEWSSCDWAHGPLHRSRQNAYLKWLQQSAPDLYSRVFLNQAIPEDTQVTQQQRTELDALPEQWSFNRWVGNKVSEWIATQSRAKPFLAIASFSVGDGLGAEPSAGSDGEVLNKQAMVQSDAAMAQVLAELSAGKQLDDTVVIVAAARGNASANPIDDAMSEQSLKVPLFIRRPGGGQQVIDAPVSTIDLAPTILAYSHAPPVARMQGGFLPGVFDESTSARGWAMSRLRTSTESGAQNWQTVFCKDQLKLIVQHGESIENEKALRLYNLASDPYEQCNLAEMAGHDTELELMIDQMIDARCALEDRSEPRIAEF